MNTHPSDLESRVSALEHRQYSLEIHTEKIFTGIATSIRPLSDDVTAVKAEVKHLSGDMTVVKADIKHMSNDMTAMKADIRHLSNNVTASFEQSVQYDIRMEGQIDARFNKIEADIADIRATMATKDDIAIINERLDRLEAAFGEHTTLLTQILERLPG